MIESQVSEREKRGCSVQEARFALCSVYIKTKVESEVANEERGIRHWGI